MDPDDPQARSALAVALMWRGSLERGLIEAQRVLILSPNSSEGLLAVARAQIFLSNPAAAIASIEGCLQLDPHFPEIALYFLGQARFSLGEYEGAVEALLQQLEHNPNSETGHALLAACYGHLGRSNEARTAWATTLRLRPDDTVEHRRPMLPFRDPADFDRRVEGLKKAGIAV